MQFRSIFSLLNGGEGGFCYHHAGRFPRFQPLSLLNIFYKSPSKHYTLGGHPSAYVLISYGQWEQHGGRANLWSVNDTSDTYF